MVAQRGLKRRIKLLLFPVFSLLFPAKNPPVGGVRFGSLRRLKPISSSMGYDRGISITRYYIYDFLEHFSKDIAGNVLEIADNKCTVKFGGTKVTKSDVLHVQPGNPQATIVADLSNASSDSIPSNTFDCIIFTQTLQMIYDVRAAIKTLYRILKPGGVLLFTGHGISQVSRHDMDRWGEYWRFTSRSSRILFEEVFLPENIYMKVYGNVLTAISFLEGLSATDLEPNELYFHDPDYELVIALRATKTA